SIEQGDVEDAVEIAIGASFLWRNALGCAEGVAWIEVLSGLDLPPRDELWALILAADVSQGRGDHRQMFSAASAAQTLIDRTDDLGAACLASHYGALAHLTEPDHAVDHL